MIASGGHDEMEVAIDLAAIALGDHGLERCRGLLEGRPCLCRVTAELEQSEPESEQRVSVGMQIVAELRRRGIATTLSFPAG